MTLISFDFCPLAHACEHALIAAQKSDPAAARAALTGQVARAQTITEKLWEFMHKEPAISKRSAPH
jgi:hypothetical protein